LLYKIFIFSRIEIKEKLFWGLFLVNRIQSSSQELNLVSDRLILTDKKLENNVKIDKK
jgi:hypothetical protein